MELNVQSIKSQERLKRNKLYQVSADDPVITWIEEHTDSEPEIVDIEFNVPQGGCAVLANEYRNKDFRKSKAADILCMVFDHENKRISTQIFDSKRTMTAFDETETADELRRDIVKRIKEFLLQIQDSMVHKDGLTVPYVKYYGYKEHVRTGIITREFDTEKLKRLEEKLRDTLCVSSRNLGMVGMKYDIAASGIRKDIEIVQNFRKKKICILNREMDLQVYLLEYADKQHGYYVKIGVGMD